jgi:hypothetical protein
MHYKHVYVQAHQIYVCVGLSLDLYANLNIKGYLGVDV